MLRSQRFQRCPTPVPGAGCSVSVEWRILARGYSEAFRPTLAASVPSSTYQAAAGQPCMIANIAVVALPRFPGVSCRPGHERRAVGRAGGPGRHP